MKRLHILLTGVLLILFSAHSRADHAAGGYFEYTCLGNNQYQVDFFFLRDCEGIQPQEYLTFSLANSCGASCVTFPVQRQSQEAVDFGCGNDCILNLGTEDNAPSFQLCKYSTTVTLNGECAEWTVSVTVNFRNETDYASGGAYYNYCTINNVGGACNSSAQIGGLPFAIGCVNSGGLTQYEAQAANGTTLSYELVDPLNGACPDIYPVTWASGLSANRPVPGSDWTAVPDGNFSYVPNMIGTSYFAVQVTATNTLGTVISRQVIDGIVYNSTSCGQGDGVHFGDFTSTGNNTIVTNSVIDEICGSFLLEANDNDENISSVTVSAPPFFSHSITHNDDGTASVTICANIPDDAICDDVTYSVSINALSSDAGCTAVASGAGSVGYYYLHKFPAEYCPQNLYITNRNTISQIAAPLNARAEERIWVGDSMPPIAPFNIISQEASVNVPNGAYYLAGLEIILPSCHTPGNSCVILEGSLTLEIRPNACSAACPQDPLTVQVDEIFRCGSEQLSVNAQGEGPFTYVLTFLGDTIVQNFSVFSIHDMISELDNGQNPYTITVYDAIGGQGSFSGEVLGTKRFYEPVTDNTIWTDYPQSSGHEDGYYYAAQLFIDWSVPFFLLDDVNTFGPWYGATYMDLIIWNRWGEAIYEYERNLQDGTDWSFNNGEIYWNGRIDNDPENPCGLIDEVVTYTLVAKNCFTPVHQENDAIGVIECFNGSWEPAETKSSLATADDAVWGARTGTMRDDLSYSVENGEKTVVCYPNPATTILHVQSLNETIQYLRMYNTSGAQVIGLAPGMEHVQLNVELLGAGIYTLSVTTETGEKHLKFVKN